jgi:hypothetical protein
VRGVLNDPATAQATHDQGASLAEPVAKPLGDLAHIIGLGASVLGTTPTTWIAIDRWAKPDGINTFYSDAGFKQGLGALVKSGSVSQYKRQTAWYGWGDFDSGAGGPRWFAIVSGRLRDPSTAQAKQDAGARAAQSTATGLGDVAHMTFTGRSDAADFVAMDIWTNPANIAAFYTDPNFQRSAADVFADVPTLSVYHATDWHQWGAVGEASLDGTWKVTSFSCNGQAVPVGDFQLEVRGGDGNFVQKFDPKCVVTLNEAYKYAGADGFQIAPTTIACTPSDSCGAILGTSCPPLAPATAFTWALAPTSLTFTRTADGPGDQPCKVGDEVKFEMARQSL